ncbi:MAG: hypothetical protein HY538_08760 [Deltaproteobacteria bacterium]|nr:hypothetical protein [Deltaproteobacteria bacterium]
MTGRYLIQENIPAEEELKQAAYLLKKTAQTKEPFILATLLSGKTMSLGRFQQARATFIKPDRPMIRRWTGGRAFPYGSGMLSLCLMAPHWQSLIQEGIPPHKILNRYVRPLLTTLKKWGLPAFYGGRDSLTVSRKPIGYLTFDVEANNALLMQSVLESQDLLALRPLQEFVTTWIQNFPRQDLRWEAFEFSKREKEKIDSQPLLSMEDPREHDPKMLWSDLCEIPIGQFYAGLQLEGQKIKEVLLFGDFIANSPAVSELEENLKGCPLEWKEIGRRVDQIFTNPRNVILGLRSLRAFPDTILNAAGKNRNPSYPPLILRGGIPHSPP